MVSQNKMVSQKETLEKQGQPQCQSKRAASLIFCQNVKEMMLMDKDSDKTSSTSSSNESKDFEERFFIM